MATYFSPSTGGIHQAADNMQTLYLMNPAYGGFPEPSPQRNIVLINQHNGNPAPSNQQQLIGVPLPMREQPSIGIRSSEVNSSFMASTLKLDGLWRDNMSELPIGQTSSGTGSAGNARQMLALENAADDGKIGWIASQVGLRGEQQQSGLSLSLASSSTLQIVGPSSSFRSAVGATSMVVPEVLRGIIEEGNEGERAVKFEGGLKNILMGSKYLKATQQLLDEVVNVGKVLNSEGDAKSPAKDSNTKKKSAAGVTEDSAEVVGMQESELTAAEKQELQMKKAKLVTMLQEVDQRYKQYRHEMQKVVSLFEAAAGEGAAKSYTALALHTISKQFRCLRDAICRQITNDGKTLGEESDDQEGGKAQFQGLTSRLRYVDHQVREQRALQQQLGIVQHNAWRPQRGLPEKAVSVLRAWLFEHFLHPYPNDSDKLMLAKQTGLTRSQVSNWFINARVRLWKPMVEEMYTEETKEHESKNSEVEKTSKSERNEETLATMKPTIPESFQTVTQTMTRNDNQEITNGSGLGPSPPFISGATTAISGARYLKNPTGFSLLGPSSSSDSQTCITNESVVLNQVTPKKIRNASFQGFNTLSSMTIHVEGGAGGGFSANDQPSGDGYSLAAAIAGNFPSYQIDEVGRTYSTHEAFAPGVSSNGVSLTLGLPHCDSLSLQGGQQQQTYLSTQNVAFGKRNEVSGETSTEFFSLNSAAAATNQANAYDNIAIQGRKRFAAQLLHDYVI